MILTHEEKIWPMAYNKHLGTVLYKESQTYDKGNTAWHWSKNQVNKSQSLCPEYSKIDSR